MNSSLKTASALLVCFLTVFSASGEENGGSAQRLGTWYTSSWSGGFTAAAKNILRGKMPDDGSTGLDTREGSRGYASLTDGIAVATDAPKATTLSDNASLTYTLLKSTCIDEVRVYATWRGPERAGVSIKSVEIVTYSGETVTIGGACDYCSSAANLAVLRMSDNSPLCTDAHKIIINFATQYTAANVGYNGYAELEVMSPMLDEIPVLETGSWADSMPETSDRKNLVLGKTPDSAFGLHAFHGTKYEFLTDGKWEKHKEWENTVFGNEGFVSYTFDVVSNVDEIRIFSTSVNTNRDRLSVDSIQFESPSGEVFVVYPNRIEYTDAYWWNSADQKHAGGCPYVRLRMVDNSPICRNAKKISINFGVQESGYVPYAELEVLGSENNDPVIELKVVDGIEKKVFENDLSFCFQASVAGLENASYDWDLDGDMIFEVLNGGDSAEIKFQSPGRRRIVVREATTGQKEAISVVAGFKEIYLTCVNQEDGLCGEPPYDAPDKASNNPDLVWPLVVPGTTVHLLPGTYNHSFVIEDGVKVLAVDPAHGATVVTNDGTKRVFEVSGSGAMISGFTISGGGLVKPSGWDETKSFEKADEIPGGACVYVHDGGVVSNCWITAPNCNLSGGAGGCVYSDNGRVVDCVIGNCANMQNIFYGSGIYQKGEHALVDRCVITNIVIKPYYSIYKIGGAVQMTGGVVRNCLIADCGFNGGAYVVPEARDRTPGILAGGGRIENCTITRNTAPLMTSGIVVYGDGVAVANSVIYGNTTSEGNSPSDVYVFSGNDVKLSHCCVGSNIGGTFSGEGNISADPLFVDSANGNFMLQKNSPCRNTADSSFYTGNSNDRDLARKLRFQGEGLDIGCYEYPVKNFMVIVR